jgi:hypothetical protein
MSTQICRRFVIDGIRDTMDHYRAGALPLHRLSWELHSRIDTLVPHAPAVWIDQLRDLHRRIAEVYERGERSPFGELDRRQVDDSLRLLRVALEHNRG